MNKRIEFDKQFTKKYILGIDEVGWGCVAGPVMLGGCLLSEDFYLNYEENVKKYPFFEKIKDSKKVSEKVRIELFNEIKNCPLLTCFLGTASCNYINKHKLAESYRFAVESILSKIPEIEKTAIIIDGNRNPKSPSLTNFELIIKGDDKSFVIGIASLFAKESRDQYMRDLSTLDQYKAYGFEKHKGYGTSLHLEAIKANGLTPEHRTEASLNLIKQI